MTVVDRVDCAPVLASWGLSTALPAPSDLGCASELGGELLCTLREPAIEARSGCAQCGDIAYLRLLEQAKVVAVDAPRE